MGRAATISTEKRATIVTLKEEGYSHRAIARRVGVSQSSVGKIFHRKIQCATVQPQKPQGRPKKTSLQTDRQIRRLAVSNPSITSHEISVEIPTPLSARTIRRRLQHMNLGAR
jgi:transposase